MISLTFETRPVPWSRSVRGDRTPRRLKQDKYIEALAIMLKIAANETTTPSFEGAVSVRLRFDFKRNETHIAVADASHREDLKATRGDLDNLCKMVLEALQKSGIVKDDAQVAMLEAEKVI